MQSSTSFSHGFIAATGCSVFLFVFVLFIFVSYQEAHSDYEDLVLHFQYSSSSIASWKIIFYLQVNKENILYVLCFKFFVPLICRCCLMPWCNMTIPHPQTWRRGQTERWSTELLDWISRTTLSTRFFLSSSPVTEEHCSQRWCLQTSCKGITERDYSSLILHSVGQSLFFCIWTWLHLVIMYVLCIATGFPDS